MVIHSPMQTYFIKAAAGISRGSMTLVEEDEGKDDGVAQESSSEEQDAVERLTAGVDAGVRFCGDDADAGVGRAERKEFHAVPADDFASNDLLFGERHGVTEALNKGLGGGVVEESGERTRRLLQRVKGRRAQDDVYVAHLNDEGFRASTEGDGDGSPSIDLHLSKGTGGLRHMPGLGNRADFAGAKEDIVPNAADILDFATLIYQPPQVPYVLRGAEGEGVMGDGVDDAFTLLIDLRGCSLKSGGVG